MHTEQPLQYPDSHPPLTGRDLFEMGDIGRSELIKGELVRMPPAGYTHGIVECHFGGIIGNFVRKNRLGHVLTGEAGIYTRRNPDTVRGADVIFISEQKLASAKSESYLDAAPELIVEILSSGDRWTDVHGKLEEYFGIGVISVWIANPKRKQILVYRSPVRAERFAEGDILKDREVLPGFEAPVADFF